MYASAGWLGNSGVFAAGVNVGPGTMQVDATGNVTLGLYFVLAVGDLVAAAAVAEHGLPC